jgi:hypothetical protein
VQLHLAFPLPGPLQKIPTLRPPEEKRDFAAQKAAKPVLRKENEAKHAKQKKPL